MRGPCLAVEIVSHERKSRGATCAGFDSLAKVASPSAVLRSVTRLKPDDRTAEANLRPTSDLRIPKSSAK